MRNHYSIKKVFSLIILLLFSACREPEVAAESQLDYVTDLGGRASINWTTKVIRVKGFGASSERILDLCQRKLAALRAAEVDAYRKALEVIKGVQVTSSVSVEVLMAASPIISAKVSGVIRGMRLLDVSYSGDGGCIVTLELNIDSEGQCLLSSLNSGDIKISDNYPKFDWMGIMSELEETRAKIAAAQLDIERLINNNEQLKIKTNDLEKSHEAGHSSKVNFSEPAIIRKQYTGLLVDARNVKLKPALAPAIVNSKNEKMYGDGVFPDKNPSGSIVCYLRGSIEKAKMYREIGDNPLVISCARPISESDIMISDEDAQKLMAINKLLQKKKVAILI